MKIDKSIRRESRINKRRNGMQRSGDSVKTIEKIQRKRRDNILNKRREQKEKLLEELLDVELQECCESTRRK